MLYVNIARDLTKKILNHDFDASQKLPSEIDLAKEYKTSKMTIRKSLQLLIDSGVIFTIPKSGYYINTYDDIKRFNSLAGNSFSLLNSKDKIDSNVIFFKLIPTNKVLKAKFRSDIKYVFELKRIRYLKGKLISLEHIYLSADLFPDFHKQIAENSIYEYIHAQGKTIATNIKTLRASFAPKEYIEYEPFLEGIPLIEIENIGFLTNGQIFEYSISYNIDHAYSTVLKYSNFFKDA